MGGPFASTCIGCFLTDKFNCESSANHPESTKVFAREMAMPISLPSSRADAVLAEQTAFQRMADTKSQEEWDEAFAAWREASAALITSHAIADTARPLH